MGADELDAGLLKDLLFDRDVLPRAICNYDFEQA